MDKHDLKAKKLRLKILANIDSDMVGTKKKPAAMKKVKTTAGKAKRSKKRTKKRMHLLNGSIYMVCFMIRNKMTTKTHN